MDLEKEIELLREKVKLLEKQKELETDLLYLKKLCDEVRVVPYRPYPMYPEYVPYTPNPIPWKYPIIYYYNLLEV